MTKRRKKLGKFGENTASDYLLNIGYNIIDRNVRTQQGEIDIIAEKNDIVYFVEVKTRLGNGFLDGYSRKQRERLNNLAASYISENNINKQISFLIVGVSSNPKDETELEIEVIEDPFI